MNRGRVLEAIRMTSKELTEKYIDVVGESEISDETIQNMRLYAQQLGLEYQISMVRRIGSTLNNKTGKMYQLKDFYSEVERYQMNISTKIRNFGNLEFREIFDNRRNGLSKDQLRISHMKTIARCVKVTQDNSLQYCGFGGCSEDKMEIIGDILIKIASEYLEDDPVYKKTTEEKNINLLLEELKPHILEDHHEDVKDILVNFEEEI